MTMTTLEEQQRGLLDLVKGRGTVPTEPYLAEVSRSPALAVVRRTALFWREFQIEQQCVWASQLLHRFGCFGDRVAQYFDRNRTSSYVEELSRDFLRHLAGDDDPLLRSVAQLELAMLEVAAGADETFTIIFDRNPDSVLLALRCNGDLPENDAAQSFRVEIGRCVSGLIMCAPQPVP